MFKKYFSDKIHLIEGSIIVFSLIWYFINKNLTQPVTPEFIINSTTLLLLLTLVLFRNNGIRHMYFGFLLLILTVVGNVFGYDQFVYIVSSLALGLFILGIINMLLFKNDHQNN